MYTQLEASIKTISNNNVIVILEVIVIIAIHVYIIYYLYLFFYVVVYIIVLYHNYGLEIDTTNLFMCYTWIVTVVFVLFDPLRGIE